MKTTQLKKFLTNKTGEVVLIWVILLFNSKNWVYKFVPANTFYKTGSTRRVKRKGIWYELDLSDYQEWLVYFYCKSDSSDHVLDYLGRSEIILDIGANIGQTALNMSRMQKTKGLNPLVHAFEPYPKTFHKLETNSKLNPDYPIRIHNLGLSTDKGTLHMLQHSPSNSGGFRMTTESVNSVAVPVISLDKFVSEHQITKIDFIKIDVEGFEIQVLEGAQKTLKTFRPILIFEYSLENILMQGGDIQNTLNLLLEMNYRIQTKEGLTNPADILQLNKQTDLICLPHSLFD